VDRTLQPGQGFTVAFALGLAKTKEPGTIPTLPTITEEDWSVWRRYLKEGNPSAEQQQVEFAAEKVELDLTEEDLKVTGTYFLRNRSRSSVGMGIVYPILSLPKSPAPSFIIAPNGSQIPVRINNKGQAESRFQISMAAQSLTKFQVRYTQKHFGKRAGYMVTSALRWPTPITRAVFVIRYPASLGRVRISYPIAHTKKIGDQIVHTIVRNNFVPDREVELRW
ncbi:MAG: hypothetical protein V1754_02660, partial [Pseudomonadota bacterium]